MDTKTHLRILYIEDQPVDAELVQDILETEGFTCDIVRVETRDDFNAELGRGGYDLIFSDMALPQFDGLSALALAREQHPDMPFIFVSGAIGEEVAIESLKNGATDYVLKQRLNRIVPVTKRALREATERTEREQAKRALAESEADLRALFGAMNDVILVLDSNGCYLQIAPTNPTVLQRPPDTALGLTLHESFPVAEADHILAHIRLALRNNQTVPLEFSMDSNGNTVWLDATISPMGENKVFLIARDITERKLAEEALSKNELKFRSVFESTLDAIFIVNNQGLIVDVNAAATQLTGVPRELLAGLSFEQLPGDSGEVEIDSMWQQFRSTGESKGENTFYSSNGEKRVVEYHGKTDFIPGYHVVVVHEITELRKAGEERLAREAAEQANFAKSEFLSRMSHELRTPLNSILGFSELLQMGDFGPKHAQYLAYILKSGKHLLNLINEVLDIARIEAGHSELSLEPVALVETIQECVDLIQPLATQRNITLNSGNIIDHTGFVLADRQRLRQVVLNILTNAVKYNRNEGSISISCENIDTRYRIQISDTGFGVSPENLPRLFLPFERLGAENTGIEGTGLGLALTKHLVEAMNGAVGVESIVGQGSMFWVELASVEGPTEQLKRLSVNPFTLNANIMHEKAFTILYVEDNLANLKLIEGILENLPNFKLVTAMQGSMALEMARQQPDLILLDLHLPDINGDAVLRKLKEDPETRAIPVVIISADASQVQKERLIAAGANDYITKPLSIKTFIQTLNKILK